MRTGIRVLAGTLMLVCALCVAQAQETSVPLEQRATQLRQILDSPDITITHERASVDSGKLIVVIGENHASVSTQRQLAALLRSAAQSQLIDAVLIEGSSGRASVRQIAAKFAVAAKGRDTGSYWDRQVDWALLAGYEAIALTHPDIPIVGVENMAEKDRYELEQSVLGWNELGKSVAAARAVVEDAFSAASEHRLSSPDLVELEAAFTLAAGRAERAAREYRASAAKALPSMLASFDQMSPAMARLKPHAKQIEQLITERRKAVTAYNELVRQHNTLAGEPASAEQRLATVEQLKLLRLQSELEEKKAKIETLNGKLEPFANDMQAVREPSDQLHALSEELKPGRTQLKAAVEDVWDRYYAFANNLAKLASTNPGKDNTVRLVEQFFANDEDRRARENRATANSRLDRRDRAMVANTARYFGQSPKSQLVGLIVGYAHLESIVQRLHSKGFGVIGIKFKGNDVTEPWEVSAWNRRLERAEHRMKEPSWLLDAKWIAEQERLLQSFKVPEQGTRATVQAKEVMYESSYLSSAQTAVGKHIAARGPTLDPQITFERYDRSIARSLAKELSGPSTKFAYAYPSAKSAEGFSVFLDGKVIPFQSFKHEQPAGSADYVVLFHEPDVVIENGVPVREIWSSLRPGYGGGGMPPPINRWSALADPDGRGNRRISLLLTHHPRRAATNVERIRKQGNLRLDQVAFLENPPSLENTRFTTKDGGHAGLVVLVARNEAELRANLSRAAKERKLEGKQVALITCGDAFKETAQLRESLLAGEALMVWSPNRQLSEAAANELFKAVQQIVDSPGNSSFRNIDDLMNRAVMRLMEKQDPSVDVAPLTNAGSYVRAAPAGTETSKRAT